MSHSEMAWHRAFLLCSWSQGHDILERERERERERKRERERVGGGLGVSFVNTNRSEGGCSGRDFQPPCWASVTCVLTCWYSIIASISEEAKDYRLLVAVFLELGYLVCCSIPWAKVTYPYYLDKQDKCCRADPTALTLPSLSALPTLLSLCKTPMHLRCRALEIVLTHAQHYILMLSVDVCIESFMYRFMVTSTGFHFVSKPSRSTVN